jgi:hypothetical protein
VALLVVLLLGGIVAVQVGSVRAQRRDRRSALLAYAAAAGGGPLAHGVVRVPCRGLDVEVELTELPRGAWGLAATCPRRLAGEARVTAGLRSFRGLGRIEHEGVTLYTDDPALARRLWTAAAAAGWRAVPGGALVVAGDRVACSARRADPAAIAAIVELVAELASWDDGLEHLLGGLAGAEPLAAPALGVRLLPDGLQVAVEVVGERSRLSASLVEPLPPGLPDVAHLLAGAGDAALTTAAEGAVIRWPHVERDLARVRAGVAALRALAGRHDDGPYR